MRRKTLLALVVLMVLAVGGRWAVRRLLVSDLMRAELERQLSAHLQQPVSIKYASAEIFPRVALHLDQVIIGSPPAIGLDEVRITTGLRPLLSRRIEDAEIAVDTGRINLPLQFTLTPRTGPAPAVSSKPMMLASIRSIRLRELTLSSGRQEWEIDADCAVNGDRLDVSMLKAWSSTTRLLGSGALTSISGLEGQFTAHAEALGVDELLAFGSGLSRPVSPAAPSPPSVPMRLALTLTAASGRLAGYEFRELATTASVTSTGVTLSPFDVGAFAGRFSGQLEVTTTRLPITTKLSGRVDGFDVVRLLEAAGSHGGITGRLGGTVSLTAAGIETQALLKTARGSMSVAITDGRMPGLEVVRPIVLAFGKPSGAPPPGAGSSFSRLGGTFALADGQMTTEDLAMQARDFDLAGSGRVELKGGAMTARADVILSRELTAQAGTDLRRYAQQDGRVVVPATFGGTLQQPTVSLDIAAATRRALGNELERRARSLLDGLFKKKN